MSEEVKSRSGLLSGWAVFILIANIIAVGLFIMVIYMLPEFKNNPQLINTKIPSKEVLILLTGLSIVNIFSAVGIYQRKMAGVVYFIASTLFGIYISIDSGTSPVLLIMNFVSIGVLIMMVIPEWDLFN